MAGIVTLTRGTTLPDSSAKADFHNLIDTATGTLSGITTADLSATAGIVDTQLATLSTAGKVNLTALVATSQAQGDIAYASSASVWSRLGAGTSGQFLKTNGAAANPAWATLDVYVPRSTWNNLSVVRTNATTVTVTADELVLQNTSFNSVRITTVSEAIAITTSGAGGLVTALSEAANTIYYIWIARKSSDGTVNGFLSTSAVFATALGQFDAGYDQGCLVGCVGNNNLSDFIPFTQTGRKYCFTTWGNMATGTLGTFPSTLAAVDLTPANMSTNAGFVPSALSNYCFGCMYVAGGVMSMSNIAAPGNTQTDVPNIYYSNSGGGGVGNRWEFDVLTADTLYAASNTTATVYLHGFELNKL